METNIKKKTVSDIITPDAIKSWSPGDVVFISAGTGNGKSYFIQNGLYEHCKAEGKRILYLVNRTYLLNKFTMTIAKEKKGDIIHLQTYQYYEANHRRTLGKYDYIIADESHFFFADAAFNQRTDICFNRILEQDKTVRIFMTATETQILGYLRDKLKLEVKTYVMEPNYGHIEELVFYHSEECLESIVEHIIGSGDKGLLFINDGKKALALYRKYEEYSMFNVSQYNKKFAQYNKSDQIQKMLQEEKFDTQLLITTTALDNGINLVDRDIKYIVCDISDTMSLVQAIGRKRIQGYDDKICLFVKVVNNRQLAGLERQNKKRLEHAEFLRVHGANEYVNSFYRQQDRSGAIYDCIDEHGHMTKRVNEQRYWKIRLDAREARQIIGLGEYGYCEYIKRKLRQREYEVWTKRKQKENIVQYLERNVGRRYYKDDKRELIETLNIRDADGRKQNTPDCFNAHFKNVRIPYTIEQGKDRNKYLLDGKVNPNLNHWYWEIVIVR